MLVKVADSSTTTSIRRVCIVTPGYISSTPRVVKEADALWDAGYSVRVIFTQGDIERAREHDKLLLKDKPWRWSAVGWASKRPSERFAYLKSTIRYQCARRLPRQMWPLLKCAEHGEGRVYSELASEAAAEPADLFIGHYPIGLAAAAEAARVWRSKLGYDAEDLHVEEQPNTKEGHRRAERIALIEEKYIQHCTHLTAASTGIADVLARRYKCESPLAIHNVFPWSDRAELDMKVKDRRGTELSLYWFSQTIGLDRGIQDVIRASGELGGPIQIHLRGSVTQSIKQTLFSIAQNCNVGERLYFHDPVPPGELLSRASEHDVGVALEQRVNASRLLSVTNKLFLYLLAGLAIAGTDVPGQRYVMELCPDAGGLYKPGDYRTLATFLERWRKSPRELQACKRAALTAAETRWNWELESHRLVRNLDAITDTTTAQSVMT